MHSETKEADALRFDRLADLTRRYARYSESAGGLGSVLGGLLALVAYVVGAFVPPEGVPGRALLASAPFVWIGGKELLRARYYQRLGRVTERRPEGEHRLHLALTLFTAAVSVGILGFFGWRVAVAGTTTLDPPAVGYLFMIGIMPVLVWRFMRTPLEFIVGVFLVCQAALILGGAHYDLWEQPQAPIAAVALIALGLKQHRDFGEIEVELRRGREGA